MGGDCTEKVDIAAFLLHLGCDVFEIFFGGDIGNKWNQLTFYMLPISDKSFCLTGGTNVLVQLDGCLKFCLSATDDIDGSAILCQGGGDICIKRSIPHENGVSIDWGNHTQANARSSAGHKSNKSFDVEELSHVKPFHDDFASTWRLFANEEDLMKSAWVCLRRRDERGKFADPSPNSQVT